MHRHDIMNIADNTNAYGPTMSLMRITLLFGSLAIALSLILLPILAKTHDTRLIPYKGIQSTKTMMQQGKDYTASVNNLSHSLIPQIPTNHNYR